MHPFDMSHEMCVYANTFYTTVHKRTEKTTTTAQRINYYNETGQSRCAYSCNIANCELKSKSIIISTSINGIQNVNATVNI